MCSSLPFTIPFSESMISIESGFLSRVEGRGFHVEGRGYYVEGRGHHVEGI